MTGRPGNDEAAPYYFNYINLIGGEDILGMLRSQLEEATGFLEEIPEGVSVHRYEPGKWSIRELLNHVTDTERAFAFRALWFARGFEAPLQSYDQNIAAAGATADRLSWGAHVEEFKSVRLATISLFGNMPAEAWLRTGIASDNRFSVRAVAFIIAGHLAHHVDVLRERYLS